MKSLIALLPALAVAAPGKHPSDDPAFRAIQDEMNRARSLKLESLDPPYYLAGYVNDSETFAVTASFGALVSKGGDAHRQVNVTVRVGSPALDNTNFAEHAEGFLTAPSPAEPDYDALRQALWLRFDGAYKNGVEALARKRAYLETNDVKDRPADFVPAPVTTLVLPRAKLQVDKDKWARAVKRASAVFRDHPLAFTGLASFHAEADNQAFASTDPVEDRFGEQHAAFFLAASTQAADGMEVSARYDAKGFTEADLPKEEELVQAAKDVAARLEALAQAPVLSEDYSGPVLFTGKAAPLFFLTAVGEPLSSPREPLGESHTGRLADRLGKHIAAPALTVRDDPTQKTWKGKPLWGYFPIDDDGVKPQAITLVDKGLLKTYYMSRVPTHELKESNGHSRAGQGSVGNLFVESGPSALSRDALKKKLADMVKADDQEYGLLVEDFTEAPDSAFFAAQSGTLALPRPAVVYRVFADGHEELVRGASFKPTSFRALKDIVALGNDPQLLNTVQRGQHISVVAPSVLVKELELKKPKDEFEKPPLTARP